MKPRIAMWHRQQTSVGYYRTWVPARWLRSQGYEVDFYENKRIQEVWGAGHEKRNKWAKEQYEKFDVIWTDRAVDEEQLCTYTGIKHYSPDCRLVCDFDDDFTNVPTWNQNVKGFHAGQVHRETSFMHMRLSELTVAATERLSESFQDRAHCVTVVKNAIDPADWEGLMVDPERVGDPHLRVFYGGAAGHYRDTDVAREAIEALIRNPPVPWRLICIGSLPEWMHILRQEYPKRVVGLPWMGRDGLSWNYPQGVAWGGFDAAIAPLLKHPFNESKSNIKFQECAVQRIPLVCSKVGPYDWDIPPAAAIKVEQDTEAWKDALRAILTDPILREKTVQTAYQAVHDEWVIDRRGHFWENAIEEALSRPRIESVEDSRLPQVEAKASTA